MQTQTLFIDPKFMADEFDRDGRTLAEMDAAVAELCGMIDKEPAELNKLLADKSASRFVKVAEDLDDNAVKQVEKLDLPGVGVVPANRRVYPMGSIACHVLGGVGGDGAGIEGVELRFDKTLAGKDGFERLTKDARRRPINVAADDYLPPQHGQHVVLTLDSNIQMIAEQELARAACDIQVPSGARSSCSTLTPARCWRWRTG